VVYPAVLQYFWGFCSGIKVVFGEKCNVVSRYSNQEMGILGQDSYINSGFKLNHGSYYFECLKMNSDERAEEGEVGRIVITDLFNYAFPLIRYDTGDTGIMVYNDNNWPIIKEIYGKQRDLIYNTKGEPVSPVTLSVYMWIVKGIKQWQFIQEKKNEYCLKLNGVPDDSIDVVIRELKKVLGEDAKIIVKYVNEIPILDSNKRRNTVCNLK
jgi:phenylacetate-CoA ligase